MVDGIAVDCGDDIDDLAVVGSEDEGEKLPELNLEALALLLNTDRVRELEAKVEKEFDELKARQSQVRYLHKLLKVINAQVDSKGNFDGNTDPEIRKLLEEAAGLGIQLPNEKYKFNSDERQRLVENIRVTCDDLNLQNEMQMQTVTRLTNERYESYQMARATLRPIHEDKVNKARAIAGK